MDIKLCRDCKWSYPEENSPWNLKCLNQRVNAKDAWALSSTKPYAGTSCTDQRRVKWFAVCGMKGKLWEQK